MLLAVGDKAVILDFVIVVAAVDEDTLVPDIVAVVADNGVVFVVNWPLTPIYMSVVNLVVKIIEKTKSVK